MMTFTLEDVLSSIYRAIDVLPIESPSRSNRFGEHRSTFRGEGHDFDRVVEYDPQIHSISQIDWRSKDAQGRVYVREFKVTKDFPTILLGDLSSSMLFGVEKQLKERMLLEVIGDIGLACFHAQDPMGFIGFSEDIIFDEEPKVGEDNIYYVLEQLYDFLDGLASDGKGRLLKSATNFYNAFDRIIKKYPDNKHFIIVVSDFIGLDEIPDTQILEDIASNHEIVFIFLDDPGEFENLKGRGYIKVENMETGQQLDISRRKFRKISADIRQKRKRFRNSLQAIGIDSMVLEYGKHFQRLHRFLDARYESFKG